MSDDAFVATRARAVLEGAKGRDEGRASHSIALTTCESCKAATQHANGEEVAVGEATRDKALCDAHQLGRTDGPDAPRATQTIPPNDSMELRVAFKELRAVSTKAARRSKEWRGVQKESYTARRRGSVRSPEAGSPARNDPRALWGVVPIDRGHERARSPVVSVDPGRAPALFGRPERPWPRAGALCGVPIDPGRALARSAAVRSTVATRRRALRRFRSTLATP